MDAETRAAIEELTRTVEGQQALLLALRQQIDLYDIHGLDGLRFRDRFGPSGGLYGTTAQAARLDHTH